MDEGFSSRHRPVLRSVRACASVGARARPSTHRRERRPQPADILEHFLQEVLQSSLCLPPPQAPAWTFSGYSKGNFSLQLQT